MTSKYPARNATVWRVDLDTPNGDYRTRHQIRAASYADAVAIYRQHLNNPPDGYETVAIVADCRIISRQMLTGDQEIIS